MDLKKTDVAELLSMSVQTIEHLIEFGKIPYYTLEGEPRFSRHEIENWLFNVFSSEQAILPFGEAPGKSSPWQKFGLYRAIHKGAVILGAESMNKEDLIHETIGQVADQLSLDPAVVAELFIERENLMSTAFNYGIAVPHTREFLLEGLFDTVVVVYPAEPFDWGALDNVPVHSLFFLFACDDKRHLNLLAKIAHFTSSEKCLNFIKQGPDKSALLDFIKTWEESLLPTPILR